jgi:hypothetical protein
MILEGIALPASSLALPAQTGDDPGYDIAGRATVEPRLNKNYLSIISFSGVINPPGFYRGSAWIVLGSSGVIRERPGKHRHEP